LTSVVNVGLTPRGEGRTEMAKKKGKKGKKKK
jgi:hypothetical protein